VPAKKPVAGRASNRIDAVPGGSLRPFDENGHVPDGLRTAVACVSSVRERGSRCSPAFGLCVQMVATIVLARLLTPADYGLVTMVTTFSLLLLNVGLNGFTESGAAAGRVESTTWTAIVLVNVWSVCCCHWDSRELVVAAKFYHEPRVAMLRSRCRRDHSFYTSSSVLHLALLKRAMCFSVVSVNDIVSARFRW